MIPFEALTGPSYTMFSAKAEIEESINVFRERVETDQGVNPFVLYRSPGLECFKQTAAGNTVNGLYPALGKLYAAAGNTLYEYSAASLTASYNPIVTDARPAYFAASKDVLLFVSAGHLYRLSAAVLAEVILDFTPDMVSFINNIFVVLELGTSRFRWSEDSGATFPADLVQTFEADSNVVVSLEVAGAQLWVIGSRVSQPYSVGPNPDAPFIANPGGIVMAGTLAPDSVCVLGDSILFIDQSGQGSCGVSMITGFQERKVSNAYIDNILSRLGRVSQIADAIGCALEINGHELYRITFPAADITLEYHKTLNEWEKLEWLDWEAGQTHRHRGFSYASAFGKVYCGDRDNGWIYICGLDVFYDYGFPIRSVRRTPHIIENNQRIAVNRLELGIQVAVGLSPPLWLNDYSLSAATFAANLATAVAAGDMTAGQALVLQSIYDVEPYTPLDPYPFDAVMTPLGFYQWGLDPQISMRSGDGNTYGNLRARSMGASGAYRTQVFWDRCGAETDFVFELSTAEPVKLAITNGYLDVAEML